MKFVFGPPLSYCLFIFIFNTAFFLLLLCPFISFLVLQEKQMLLPCKIMNHRQKKKKKNKNKNENKNKSKNKKMKKEKKKKRIAS